MLLLVVVGVSADEASTSAAFNYTDDWVLVSAPPPPGPYRAVNIDPRVPGQDTVPDFSMGMAPDAPAGTIPAEALANPPAAGHKSVAQPSQGQGMAEGCSRRRGDTLPGELPVRRNRRQCHGEDPGRHPHSHDNPPQEVFPQPSRGLLHIGP